MDKAARDEYNRQYYAKNKAKIDAKQSAKEECKHCGRSVRHENIWKHMKTDYCKRRRDFNRDLKKRETDSDSD
eukprot:scaffold5998_cov440-Ochromonas_danica.AAC.2